MCTCTTDVPPFRSPRRYVGRLTLGDLVDEIDAAADSAADGGGRGAQPFEVRRGERLANEWCRGVSFHRFLLHAVVFSVSVSCSFVFVFAFAFAFAVLSSRLPPGVPRPAARHIIIARATVAPDRAARRRRNITPRDDAASCCVVCLSAPPSRNVRRQEGREGRRTERRAQKRRERSGVREITKRNDAMA